MRNSDLPGRIVVVDDDPTVADVVGRYLVRDGHTVECVHDGHEALRRIAEQQPDLVVLDLMLPGIDGLEVCRRLRERPTLNHVRIVAMTGFPSSENIERIMAAGADACLSKPLDSERLLEELGLGVSDSESG